MEATTAATVVHHPVEEAQVRIALAGQHPFDRTAAATCQLGKPRCIDAPRLARAAQIPAENPTRD
jgi:hypothetical protein